MLQEPLVSLKTFLKSAQNESLSSEICSRSSTKLAVLYQSFFSRNWPRKFPQNSREIGCFFREFDPENPAKFDFFPRPTRSPDFHLQPQYKYELFHIYFTWFHCTGRYELNKLTLLPMCGFTAQLVEHRIRIAEVMGSNPVEALIFFWLLLSSCLNWKIYCDDHTSLSK